MAFDANHRHADHDVDPLFLKRWSPRAFTGERIDEETLRTIFEAARWAPSAFNLQPWRYVYAHREGPDWRRLLDILIPYNQSWVETGVSVLAFAISDRFRRKAGAEPEPLYSHSFDAGAAWACLAIQASRMGLAAHGMSGFHVDKAYAELGVPEDQYRIEAAIALGRPTKPDVLPDAFRAREIPSPRNPVDSFVFEGKFRDESMTEDRPPGGKSPQEKKALSYAKDRRNAFSENAKSSRKNIPAHKAREHREERRAVNRSLDQITRADEEAADRIESDARQDMLRTGGWTKSPDIPLKDWIERQSAKAEIRPVWNKDKRDRKG